MEMTSRQLADVTVIQVQGRIDHKTAMDFEEALRAHLDPGPAWKSRKLIMDLGRVDFMTSAGLRVLMIAAKMCDKQKWGIAVAALQPGIREIFKISRFDLVIAVFPTVKSALESLSPNAAPQYEGLENT
jgi:anti-anti-sigma factor